MARATTLHLMHLPLLSSVVLGNVSHLKIHLFGRSIGVFRVPHETCQVCLVFTSSMTRLQDCGLVHALKLDRSYNLPRCLQHIRSTLLEGCSFFLFQCDSREKGGYAVILKTRESCRDDEAKSCWAYTKARKATAQTTFMITNIKDALHAVLPDSIILTDASTLHCSFALLCCEFLTLPQEQSWRYCILKRDRPKTYREYLH